MAIKRVVTKLTSFFNAMIVIDIFLKFEKKLVKKIERDHSHTPLKKLTST